MDIDEFDSPNHFFDYRVGKAFPGVRGVKEFNNPKECVDRLEILLRNPLNRNKKNMTDPIWWLRGSSNNEISSFERLDSERFLMDGKQLKVKKIVVYSSLAYYKKFVYVEGPRNLQNNNPNTHTIRSRTHSFFNHTIKLTTCFNLNNYDHLSRSDALASQT